MVNVRIEREIAIEAPIEVVWDAVTDPAKLVLWFADEVDLVVEPGARGYIGFDDQGGPVVVETVEAPTTFAFRWNFAPDEQPIDGNSMLVTFTLHADAAERTTVRVVETGHELRDWPEAEKARYADEHNHGWPGFLERLAATVTGRPG